MAILTGQSGWVSDRLSIGVNLPDPDVLAGEIVEDLQTALAQFAEIAEDLAEEAAGSIG